MVYPYYPRRRVSPAPTAASTEPTTCPTCFKLRPPGEPGVLCGACWKRHAPSELKATYVQAAALVNHHPSATEDCPDVRALDAAMDALIEATRRIIRRAYLLKKVRQRTAAKAKLDRATDFAVATPAPGDHDGGLLVDTLSPDHVRGLLAYD